MLDVCVVCDNPDEDYILPRMAHALRKHNGWPVSDRPRKSADVNYFLPYYLLPQIHDWDRKGKLFGAWFTHKDVTDSKIKAWNKAAVLASFHCVTGPQWTGELAIHGPTYPVQFGIDREKFVPKGPRVKKWVIGTSGWVYSGGRKGERLVRRLLDDDLGIGFLAAGWGWPGGSARIKHDEMPNFYRSLGVYVCTSLIEGGPAGPIEALACGVRVVVPMHVGVLDSLPDIPGIHRYIPGNYGSFRLAIDEALNADPTPDSLRDATSKFTYENWALETRIAVEGEWRHLQPIN